MNVLPITIALLLAFVGLSSSVLSFYIFTEKTDLQVRHFDRMVDSYLKDKVYKNLPKNKGTKAPYYNRRCSYSIAEDTKFNVHLMFEGNQEVLSLFIKLLRKVYLLDGSVAQALAGQILQAGKKQLEKQQPIVFEQLALENASMQKLFDELLQMKEWFTFDGTSNLTIPFALLFSAKKSNKCANFHYLKYPLFQALFEQSTPAFIQLEKKIYEEKGSTVQKKEIELIAQEEEKKILNLCFFTNSKSTSEYYIARSLKEKSLILVPRKL